MLAYLPMFENNAFKPFRKEIKAFGIGQEDNRFNVEFYKSSYLSSYSGGLTVHGATNS